MGPHPSRPPAHEGAVPVQKPGVTEIHVRHVQTPLTHQIIHAAPGRGKIVIQACGKQHEVVSADLPQGQVRFAEQDRQGCRHIDGPELSSDPAPDSPCHVTRQCQRKAASFTPAGRVHALLQQQTAYRLQSTCRFPGFGAGIYRFKEPFPVVERFPELCLSQGTQGCKKVLSSAVGHGKLVHV